MKQKQLFLKIWETRPHVSEISGKPLLPVGHYQWHWQFAHVLNKGSYPRYKFKEENIMLMLPSEHEKQEQFKKFQDRKLELKSKYYETSC
ncbi:MAG: hypothetical protein H6552_00460 [Chitinophagales bacterium]|nr:hypothetical protein [Chitinophagales bacterium]